MKRLIKSTLIILGFIIALSNPAEAGAIIRSNSSCKAIGLILKSEDPGIKGHLCEDDQLQIDSQILITCRNKRESTWVKRGKHEVNSLCSTERQSIRKCLIDHSCFRNQFGIVLIGNTFASQDPMPILRWHPVEGSEGYEILIRSSSGNDLRRQILDEPEYSFEQPLKHGELYQLKIFALGTKNSGRFAYYLPKLEDLANLNSSLEVIRNSGLSELDKAIYQDSVYLEMGLLSDAVQALESSSALQGSIELQRLLGIRYIESGYFEKAKATYMRIAQLAPEGSQEHSEALEILQLYSQLPTKTKLPQS